MPRDYYQVTSTVAGALDVEEDVRTPKDVAKILQGIHDAATEAQMIEGDDFHPSEVWVLYHPHAPEEQGCMCASFSTDHRPRWTFPNDPPPSPEEI